MCGAQRIIDPDSGRCHYSRFKRLAHQGCCALSGGRLAGAGDSGCHRPCWYHFLAYIQALAEYRTMVVERSGL